MKKIFLIFITLIPTILFAGKYDVAVTNSTFDDSISYLSKESPALVSNKNAVTDMVVFSGAWNNKQPDIVVLNIKLYGNYVNITELSLNVDGVIDTFKNTNLTNLSPIGQFKQSSTSFIVTRSYFRRLINSNEIRFKLNTINEGYKEGFIKAQQKEYPAFLGLKALNNEIEK